MKKENKNISKTLTIRQKAEARLKKRKKKEILNHNEADTQRLVHELEVHQIQLEMQNVELQLAHEKSEKSTEKFTSLYNEIYNLSTAGFFTIKFDGTICELNLSGSEMLGKNRSELVNSNLKYFISPDTKNIFNNFIKLLLNSKTKETCEVKLTGKSPRIIHIEGIITEHNEKCLLTVIDLTERKVAEEVNRKSKEKYQSLITATSQIVWTTNSQGEVAEDIPTWRTYTGQSEEEIKGWGWSRALHPDDVQRVTEIWNRSLEKRILYDTEYRIRRYDGEYRYFSVRGVPILGSDGKINEWIGVCIDIDERKRAENVLRENEEKYRTLFESSRDAIYILEHNSRDILDANPSACKLYGYTKEEMKKLNVMDITAEPEETKSGFENGLKWIPLRNHRKKDGTIFPAEISIGPYVLRDGRYNVVYVRDVTERKLAEKELIRLATFPTLNPNPILEINLSNETIFINKVLINIIDQLGLIDASFFIPDDINEIKKILKKDTKNSVKREVFINDRYFEQIICFAPGFETLRIYGRDITEYRKAELKILDSEAKYKTLFEEAVDGIVMVDIETYHIIDCNKALCNLVEKDKNEFLQKSIGILHPSLEELKKVPAFTENDIIDEQTLEAKISTKKGEVKDVEMKLSTFMLMNRKIMLGIIRDVTERKRIENELINSEKQLRELAHHLQSVREEERTTLSRSLHDNYGQSLTGLKMQISYLEKKLSKQIKLSEDEEIFEKIKSMIALVDELVMLTGRISMELRPNVLDMLGIKSAIEWLVKDFTNKSGIECKLASNIATIDLNPQCSTEVFRILQEALTNVIRHTKATLVSVDISIEEDNYIIIVKDNGIGITESEIKSLLSMGIVSMRERALLFGGEIKLSGKKGKGTKLLIKIPAYKK